MAVKASRGQRSCVSVVGGVQKRAQLLVCPRIFLFRQVEGSAGLENDVLFYRLSPFQLVCSDRFSRFCYFVHRQGRQLMPFVKQRKV